MKNDAVEEPPEADAEQDARKNKPGCGTAAGMRASGGSGWVRGSHDSPWIEEGYELICASSPGWRPAEEHGVDQKEGGERGEALGLDVTEHGEEAYESGEGAILIGPEGGVDELAVAGR